MRINRATIFTFLFLAACVDPSHRADDVGSEPPPDASARTDVRASLLSPPGAAADAPPEPLDAGTTDTAGDLAAAPADRAPADGAPADAPRADVASPSDGVLPAFQGPRPMGVANLPLMRTNADPMRFGADEGGGNWFPGQMDRIRMYSRPIAPEEVWANAHRHYIPCDAEHGCVGEWTFEARQGDTFPSSAAGVALPAKIVGGLQIIDGPEGKAVQFGKNAYLEVADHPAIQFTTGFSFEAWVRRDSKPCPYPETNCSSMRMAGKGRNFKIDAHAGTHRFEVNGIIGHGGQTTEDEWTHVAITYSNKQGVRYYKQGRIRTECTKTCNPGQGTDF